MPSRDRDLTLPLVAGLLLVVLVLGLWQANRRSVPPTPPPSTSGSASPTPQATPSLTTPPTPTPSTPPVPPVPTAIPTPSVPSCLLVPEYQRLRVLTFNIHRGHRDMRPELERIGEEIAAVRADVVFLQEVDRDGRFSRGTNQAEWLGNRLRMNWEFGVNVGVPGSGPGYGTAILSRYPIVRWRNTHLVRHPGTEQRGLLNTVIEVKGQPVSLYGTHLDHTSGSLRNRQMRQVMQTAADEQGPWLLGGDLNATPDSRTLRIAYKRLQDAWAKGTGDGLTVPPNVPRRRIDYLLHSPDVLAEQAGTVKSAVSDHRAVWADLRVPVRKDSC